MARSGDAAVRDESSGRNRWLEDAELEVLAHVWEIFVTALAFVFLGLFVAELTVDFSPAASRRIQLTEYLLWGIFATDFTVRLVLAPDRRMFLRKHWLAALSVLLPWFRVFRAARAVRAARSLRVIRLVTTGNRGMTALRRIAGFGGVGYVLGLSAIVLLLASAGLYSLEAGADGSPIDSYGAALWWGVTTIVALNSGDHPVTLEGRILGVIVMVYGLAISGYITAVMAVALLGLRESRRDAPGDAAVELRRLREEVRSLRQDATRPSAAERETKG